MPETKKYGPNERTDQNSRKRTKWRGPRQPIRYRVQNTGNQDDQSELTEFGPKMKEVMKAIQSEIKENIQGTNSEGKETGTQLNILEQEEETNIQPEQNEETRI